MQSDPSLVFVGGPVEPDALIAIARVREPLPPSNEDDDENDTHLAPLSGDLASADLAADPIEVVDTISALRVFRGYAGWGPGQLDGEIEAGAWLVLDPEPDRPLHRRTRRPLARRAAPASPAASPGSPTRPTTSPPTDASDAGLLARPGVA